MGQNSVIALTRCLGRQKIDTKAFRKDQLSDSYVTMFHFKGFYNGQLVKKLVITGSKTAFIKGQDYIIEMDNSYYFNGLLVGNEVRSRDLRELNCFNFV